MPNQTKLQRWTDLLAALLRHHRSGATFTQIRAQVPGYYDPTTDNTERHPSIERTFERDKDELRALGVPIESVIGDDGAFSRYRLKHKDFYLPYLELEGASDQPRVVNDDGYRSLPRVGFEPDHIAALVRGATLVAELGDAALAHEARMGLRRLAHDLPIDATLTAPVRIVTDGTLDDALLDTLGDAVRRRKRVRFRYHSIERDVISERDVAPYGIAHINGNWYLAGLDAHADGLRNFRVRRMQDVSVSKNAPGTPEFDVPADFDLWAHTRSRASWDLGDTDVEEIHVRFVESAGYINPARELGDALDDDPDVRVFRVRRRDAFLRWILGFAGGARIVAPEPVVAEYRALIAATAALYATEVTR
jgi:proteasome accessory factor B